MDRVELGQAVADAVTASGYRIVWHIEGHPDEVHHVGEATYGTEAEAEDAAAEASDVEAQHPGGGLEYRIEEVQS